MIKLFTNLKNQTKMKMKTENIKLKSNIKY